MKRPLILAGALALSVLGGRPARAQTAYEQLQMLTDALNLVRGNYVDSVGYSQLARAAINGILRSLDPHSYFMAARDFAQLSALEAGKLAGPGLSLTEIDTRIIVLSVLPRGAAERAGVQAGDRLLLVNDTPTVGSRAAEIEVRMSGPQRKRITLTLERGTSSNPDTLRLALRTEELRDLSITDTRVLASMAGYVRLAQFGSKAAQELESAVKQLRGSGARGIILDLRSNPGGRVVAAVEIAQLFLPKGALVFRTDGRKTDTDQEYRTERNGPFLDVPLILLVDGATASAAEALAASLQDHKRARLVGRRTFGKALVQAPFFLKTGDVLWLTIARVFSPNGRLIQRDYTSIAPEAYLTATRSDSAAGGVAADVSVAESSLPTWWGRALASGAVYAVADSVAGTLPATAQAVAWQAAPDEWARLLLPPLLAKMQRSQTELTPAARSAAARLLAARAAEVRWGVNTTIDLLLASDPDVKAAETALRGGGGAER
ncbi:MAG: S41 family peptidase [Longimicrobiales bacterium]